MGKYFLHTITVSVVKTLCHTLKGFFIVGLACFIFGNSTIAAINDNLIAYWNFDESQGSQIYDDSGMGNTGTIIGATRINGIAGKALSFDGINDYAEVANRSAQQVTTNQLSVSMWINLQHDIGATQNRLICKQEYGNNGNGWGLELFGKGYWQWNTIENEMVFHDSNGTAPYNCLSGISIKTGTWHQVGAVDNAGIISFYLDGQLLYTNNYGYGISQNIPAAIMLGRTCYNPWGATFYYKGFMDEVRLYDRALTSSEMQELYLIPEPATILLVGLGFLSLTGNKKQ